MISDFTTNLIRDFLLRFSQASASRYIASPLRRQFWVSRAKFHYDLERWMPAPYELPVYRGDYVILTPKNILTKDDTWISRGDLARRFEDIPDAMENDQLRAGRPHRGQRQPVPCHQAGCTGHDLAMRSGAMCW